MADHLSSAFIEIGFHGNGIHICGPRGVYFRAVAICPEEQMKRRFVILDEPWYGQRWHCCGCGDTFTEDGRDQRPFMPKWREKAIHQHKELWKIATTRRDANQWLREEMGG